MTNTDNPLVSETPAEVPLSEAPLIRVIAQVRFPLIVSVEQRGFIGAFQEAIRPTYPVLREERTQGVVFGPEGMAPARSQVAWRFADGEDGWRVSLAPDFIALETTAYKSRDDFLGRLSTVLEAFNEHIGSKIAERVGVRYIDRVTGEAVGQLRDLVRPEVLGVIGTTMAGHIQHSVSDSVFEIPESEAKMRARWGCLPPGGTVDPTAIEPVDTQSWIIDLDMFSGNARAFDPDALVAEVRAYAERIYTLFRWAITDEFLRLYGGEV